VGVQRRWRRRTLSFDQDSSAGDCVDQLLAAKELRLLTGSLGLASLISRGILHECVVEGAPGITRQSIDAEKLWWSNATLVQKARRRVDGFFLYF
jgi:hypothetical protein